MTYLLALMFSQGYHRKIYCLQKKQAMQNLRSTHATKDQASWNANVWITEVREKRIQDTAFIKNFSLHCLITFWACRFTVG